MLSNLKRGDKVLTAGGIYGKIVNMNGNEMTVEIAKGINIQMVRSGISSVINSEKSNTKLKGEK